LAQSTSEEQIEESTFEIRKVQKVGNCTLTVSLPREWVEKIGLHPGGLVTIGHMTDGSLRLTPGTSPSGTKPSVGIINADLCDQDDMLTQVLTGNYILGRDTIALESAKGFSPRQLAEIRCTVERLTGLSVVDQTTKRVVIQSFVDPSKFPVSGLMLRLHKVAGSMHDMAVEALFRGRHDIAERVIQMEEEADKIYWLVVRQLLQVARNTYLAKPVGILSPLHVIGNRVVAKYLEGIADCAEKIAREMLSLRDDSRIPKTLKEEIKHYSQQVKKLTENSMDAFADLDLILANRVIATADHVRDREYVLADHIISTVSDRKKAVALRAIVRELSEMSRYADMIAEVAINRFLEKSSEICVIEKP